MIWYYNSQPVQKNQECAVPLYMQGESDVTQYTADVSDWLALWPDGTVVVVLRPADGSAPYMADTSLNRETGVITWNITAFDTAIVGYGVGELRLVADNYVKKSYPFKTYVKASVLAAAGDPPAPVPDWVNEAIQQMQQSANAAQAAQQGAEAAQEAAETAQEAAETAQAATEQAAGAQIEAINSAGAQQIGSVQAEGAAQVAAVQQKGEETLASIPDDYTELSGDVADLKSAIEPIEEKDILVSSASDATQSTIYLLDGTTTTNSAYKTTDFIDCTNYKEIEYKLSGGTSTSPAMALIAFFDTDKTFLIAVGAIINNGWVESAIPVPNNAKYAVFLIRQGVSTVPYVYGVKKNTLQASITGLKGETLSQLEEVPFNPVFDDPICYLSDGTRASGGTGNGARRMSRCIDCNNYDTIRYGLIGISTQRMIVFYDENLSVVGYKNGLGTNAYQEGDISVPAAAKYVSGSWLFSSTQTPYMYGIKSNSIAVRLKNTEALTNSVMPDIGAEVVNKDMSVSDFATAYRNGLDAYADLCLCSIKSFRALGGLSSFSEIYNRVNSDLRQDVYMPGITHEMFCARLNDAFTHRIRRFEDIKLNNTTSNDFSVKFTERSGEPSLYVSPDGGTLYVYGYNKRFSTTDGMAWSEPTSVVLSDGRSFGHASFSVVDDVIYLIARDYTANSDHNLVMYTSPIDDGINFTYRGVPLPIGHNFGDGLQIDNWGNSYLLKDGGIYYLFIEGRQDVDGNFWDIYLVTCTDPFTDNGDGTIGNWQNCEIAPVIQARGQFDTAGSIAFGNPDIARGMDNRPIRVDGKWYMYFHSTAMNYSYILRAYSDDLVHWIPEFRVFDNRLTPTAGQNQSSNADHSLIEFKGRTYFFYTTDINTSLEPHLAYMIDDRPFREILKLRP